MTGPESIEKEATGALAAAAAWEWAMQTLNPVRLEEMTEGQKELVKELVSEQLQAWCDLHPNAAEAADTAAFGAAIDSGFHLWTGKMVQKAMLSLEESGMVSRDGNDWSLTDMGREYDFSHGTQTRQGDADNSHDENQEENPQDDAGKNR